MCQSSDRSWDLLSLFSVGKSKREKEGKGASVHFPHPLLIKSVLLIVRFMAKVNMQISPPKRSSLSRWEYAIPIKMNTFELDCGDSDSKALPLSLSLSPISFPPFQSAPPAAKYGTRVWNSPKYGRGNKCFPSKNSFFQSIQRKQFEIRWRMPYLGPPLSLWHYWRRKGEETRSEEDVIFLLHLGAKLIPPPLPSAPNETKLWGMGGREEGRALKVGLSLCEGIASGPKKGNKGEREREK